jgi:hypothetical protein
VWDRLLAELCRQVSVECVPRGALLQRGVARLGVLLLEALNRCDVAQRDAASARAEAAAAQAQAAGLLAERAALEQQLDGLKVRLQAASLSLPLVGL